MLGEALGPSVDILLEAGRRTDEGFQVPGLLFRAILQRMMF
jgi:hypothetical protein